MSSFWSAFAVVFVAELGDKSQLVALGLGARYRLRWVLTGMALAYIAANLLSVTVGATLGAALPDDVVLLAGGVLFAAFAIWTLVDDDDDDDATSDAAVDAESVIEPDTLARPTPENAHLTSGRVRIQVVGSVAVTMFVAELGDKTMFATATLASTQADPVLVWLGATVGIFVVGTIGAVAGRAIGNRVSPRLVRVGAAAIFGVFAVVLIASALR